MTVRSGTTLASTAASLAIALAAVLAISYWLLALEHRLEGNAARATAHALLGVRTAHAATWSAPLLIRSHHMPMSAPAGSVVEVTLGFKNASTFIWRKGTDTHVLLERRNSNAPSVFMADNWIDTMRAAGQAEQDIPPGALALFTARFRVPVDVQTYHETFTLRTLNGSVLEGSETDITITATDPGTLANAQNPFTTSAPTASSAQGSDGTDPFFIAYTPQYTEEPTIRIGVDYTEPSDDRWFPHIVTTERPFRIVGESGATILRVPGGERVAIDYRPSTSTYHIKHGTSWYTANEPLRFIPDDARSLMHLPSYTTPLRWEGNTADNLFRGILEIRFVSHTDRLWAINELGLEDYLRGITETDDGAHSEFHKAQVVAARTFALYHLEHGGKYSKGQFILRNDARDQVYRGENAALRRPNLVNAVAETRGVVVTHNGAIAVTPYFAQSNGQTKAWTEAWGGTPKAWLTGVADPVCAGKREIGHGVGLAQRCAMTLAEQGWSWQAILHHYYSNIGLQKLYD